MTVAIDWTLPWLSYFPVAVDLVNTVIPQGAETVDLLADEGNFEKWLGKQRHRLPAIRAPGLLPKVRELRSPVSDLLYAVATDAALPRRALDRLNDASASAPFFPALHPSGRREIREVNEDPVAVFCASIARSAIDLVSTAECDLLSVCDAPSCGMLFMQEHPRQKWCTTACGNRARVARHAARGRRSHVA